MRCCCYQRALQRTSKQASKEALPVVGLFDDLNMVPPTPSLLGGLSQGHEECLFVELDASTFMNNFAGGAGGAVGSTSASLPVELRYGQSKCQGLAGERVLLLRNVHRQLECPLWRHLPADVVLCVAWHLIEQVTEYLRIGRAPSCGRSVTADEHVPPCSCGGKINKTLANWSTWPMPYGTTQLTFPPSECHGWRGVICVLSI